MVGDFGKSLERHGVSILSDILSDLVPFTEHAKFGRENEKFWPFSRISGHRKATQKTSVIIFALT